MRRALSRTLSWLFLLASALPLAGAAPPPAPAASSTWTAVGPNGGWVNALVGDPVHPQVLYAATSGGVYRSADAGADWASMARQIGQQPVYALAADPVRSGILYAGTAAEGIWKSADGGASWAPSSAGLPAFPAVAIAVDPVATSTVYVALAGGTASGPYKSTDGGRTWKRADSGFASAGLVSLAIDPVHPAVLYAARQSSVLAKSTDGGATWQYLVTPFKGVLKVAVRPRPGGTYVYAVTPPFAPAAAIYRSADGGATWSDVTPHVLSTSSGFPLGFGPGGLLYTQGAKSSDFGDHWTATASTDAFPSALLVDPASPGTVYAASSSGVWKSLDGAATWAGSSRGLHASSIVAVAVNPESGGVLSSVSGSGLFRLRQSARSADPGAWRAVFAQAPGFVVFDPTRPSILYASLNGEGSLGENHLAKSTDGGITWKLLSLSDSCLDLADLAIDPDNPDVLYAAGLVVDTHDCIRASSQTYKSTDGGATWRRMTLGDARRIRIDRFDRTLYAVGFTPRAGIYKSADGGLTWHLASGGPGSGEALDLALDEGPGRLFASTTDGIYASVDGAKTWQRVSAALQGATVLEVDPASPSRLYAGVPGVGVFLSRTSGTSWSPLNDGHLAALFSGALALDPTTPNRLYVGTKGAGLFRVDVTP